MRTTLTIQDEIAKALKEHAFHTGKSFKDTVNETLQKGLAVASLPPQPKAYTLEPARLGNTLTNIDLKKALQVADDLEDKEIIKKMELRK